MIFITCIRWIRQELASVVSYRRYSELQSLVQRVGYIQFLHWKREYIIFKIHNTIA